MLVFWRQHEQYSIENGLKTTKLRGRKIKRELQ
jgi:hypothetical protein